MAKKGKVSPVALFLLLALFVWSCEKVESPKGKELARVDDRVITLKEFNREIEELPSYVKPLMVSAKARKEFLQNLIDRELLLEAGRKKGFDRDREILAKLDRLRKGLIIEALLAELFEGKDEVSDEEVERYYRENKEKFFVGERVRVRHIVVKTRPEAEHIKERLKRGEDFIELARRYSISPSREKGGDLGYIERGKVGKEFEGVAFSLKTPGEISDIVKTTFGYHIIRLEERRESYERTFAEARKEIRDFLQEKKRGEILTAYLKDLRNGSKIVISEELLTVEEGGK